MENRIKDYNIKKFLGQGSYGHVYLCQKDNSNKLLAMKKIDLIKVKQNNKLDEKYLRNEIEILKKVNHRNIIRLEDYFLHENKTKLYIVTEYANGGQLSDCLSKYKLSHGKAFPEEIVQYLMKQLVYALIYLHNKNIIHRDLKLDNIMVHFDSDKDIKDLAMLKCTLKIIDFGFAITLSSPQSLTTSVLGTPQYMAPNILECYVNRTLNKIEYGTEADIWSLGCICYEMLRGKNVFDVNSKEDLVNKMMNGKYKLPKTVSQEVISFLIGMLQYEGKNRLTAQELIKKSFLTKNIRDFTYLYINKDLRQSNEVMQLKNNLEAYKEKNEDLKKINNTYDKNQQQFKQQNNNNNPNIHHSNSAYIPCYSFYGDPMSNIPSNNSNKDNILPYEIPNSQFNFTNYQQSMCRPCGISVPNFSGYQNQPQNVINNNHNGVIFDNTIRQKNIINKLNSANYEEQNKKDNEICIIY